MFTRHPVSPTAHSSQGVPRTLLGLDRRSRPHVWLHPPSGAESDSQGCHTSVLEMQGARAMRGPTSPGHARACGRRIPPVRVVTLAAEDSGRVPAPVLLCVLCGTSRSTRWYRRGRLARFCPQTTHHLRTRVGESSPRSSRRNALCRTLRFCHVSTADAPEVRADP